MTLINWISPVGGDWNLAANWSTGAVPTSADDVTISAPGPYIVTVGSAITIRVGILHFLSYPTANSLTFNAPEAALQENTGKLTVAGVLAFGNAGALGTGAISLSGGELLGTANETVTNALSFVGASTIAAAHGTTLNLESSNVSIQPVSTLNFGSLGEDGVVVWDAIVESGFPIVDVVAGTLEADGPSLNDIINFGGEAVTVDAGATLDLAGNPMAFPLLGG